MPRMIDADQLIGSLELYAAGRRAMGEPETLKVKSVISIVEDMAKEQEKKEHSNE